MICGSRNGNGNETGLRGESGTEGRICIALVPVLVFAKIRTDLEAMIGIDQTTSQVLLDSRISIPGLRIIGHPHIPLLGYLPHPHLDRKLRIAKTFISNLVRLNPPLVRAETSREERPPSYPHTFLRNVEAELRLRLYRNSLGPHNHLFDVHHALHRHSYRPCPRQSTSLFPATLGNSPLQLEAAAAEAAARRAGPDLCPSVRNSSCWISTALWSIATSRAV
jgi:hypothetical protein